MSKEKPDFCGLGTWQSLIHQNLQGAIKPFQKPLKKNRKHLNKWLKACEELQALQSMDKFFLFLKLQETESKDKDQETQYLPWSLKHFLIK